MFTKGLALNGIGTPIELDPLSETNFEGVTTSCLAWIFMRMPSICQLASRIGYWKGRHVQNILYCIISYIMILTRFPCLYYLSSCNPRTDVNYSLNCSAVVTPLWSVPSAKSMKLGLNNISNQKSSDVRNARKPGTSIAVKTEVWNNRSQSIYS